MDENKNIGKAFKERLNELNNTPSDNVWDNIVNELDGKKRKRKIIPLWYKLAGIAAILLFIFTVGYKITTTNNSKKNPIITTYQNDSINKFNDPNEKVITKNKQLENKNDGFINLKTQSDINTKNNVIKNKLKNHTNHLTNTFVKPRNQIIKKNNLNSKSDSNIKPEITETNLENTIANSNNTIKINTEKNKKNDLKDEILEKELLALTEQPTKDNLITSKNSLKLNINEENQIHITEVIEKENTKKAWKIAIKGAPIYYSSLSNGSSINENLTNNSKSSDITLSYGISASYSINKKTQIRTGINKVDLAYKTNQVSIDALLNSQTLTTDFESFIDINNALIIPENQFDITQEITYLEIPLELNYQLINKKIDVNLITGISTLFLNNNTILIDDSANIGSVKNLNKISFTGNLGLGLNYNLSKNFNFNLEPILKIQLNTYKDNTDYKPYFFGIYTGFSYQF